MLFARTHQIITNCISVHHTPTSPFCRQDEAKPPNVVKRPAPGRVIRIFADQSSSMRRLLFLPLLIASFALHAQESRNGPKLGLAMATQTAGQFLSWSGLPKFGPLAGWSFEAPLTHQVSLLIEPMYMSKGSITVNSQLKTRSSVELGYLEMPLMLKVSTNPDPQGLFLTAGIMYGYLLRGQVKNYQYGQLVSKYDFSPTGSTNRGQWSAGVGVGHEIKNWMWEVRGQSSLNTFDRFVRSHNVVFSAQIAWRFPTQKDKEEKKKAREEREEDDQ